MIPAILQGVSRDADTTTTFFRVVHWHHLALAIALGTLFIGSAALVVAWLQYKNTRPRRRLVYSTTKSPLARVNARHADQVEVRYKGEKVDATLIGVWIENTGSETIRSADFESLLRISFGDSARVLTADPVEEYAADVRPVIKVSAVNFIELEPLLLNKGDRIRLSILAEGVKDEVAVAARIVGIREIEKRENGPEWLSAETHLPHLLAFIFACGLVPGFIAAIGVHDATLRKSLLLEQAGAILVVACGGILGWLFSARQARRGKWPFPEVLTERGGARGSPTPDKPRA